jgi:transposase
MLFQHRMSRYDLTDFDWRGIEPLLPGKSRCVPRASIRLGLTAGQAHDGQVAGKLLDQFPALTRE